MIEKKRLEELIEQEATIWVVYDEDRIERIKLVVRMMGVSVDEYNKIHDCEPMLYSQFCGIVRDICPISWLFETKEEAEWHKEFGCIERTERLELLPYEEICDGANYYKQFTKKGSTYGIALNIVDERILLDGCYNMPLTKENYTLACRKAKELFLGEKK